jgi:hypothetical protein
VSDGHPHAPVADQHADSFISALLTRLEADDRVIGLVLAGSSAEPARRDRWSDHDFLMITEDGAPEEYRTNLSWLPDAGDIGIWFRETPHGLKVLYRSGLLVEFAVFDRAEFAACSLNHFAVALDRGGITELAAEVHARTGAAAAVTAVDRLATLRHALCLVYIGTNRARRGELLSANVFLRDYATAAYLRLLHDLLPPERTMALDVLDPWRRVEQADPETAAALDRALAGEVTAVGRALMAAMEPALDRYWPQWPRAEAALVRDLLAD